ncbi:hypothetical protein FIBSPDRAFT_889783 [Athelia psychrophila]|uniref:Uncharacterized protein n=1 Tax=Athelia psychrophila TaxID=1759441 RepID=A0A166LMZ4_9AGAM|nr:hypothetical protein FIBSPDRAFT_889783 [Fibularhizoctonia sp. CBS 109695]
MADLTVLIAPQPLPRTTTFGRFTRRVPSPASRPIMVTLQLAADEPSSSSTGSSSAPSPISTNTEFDRGLLSPPRNTWKARQKPRPRPAHIHTPTPYIHPNPHSHILEKERDLQESRLPPRPASAPPLERKFRLADIEPQTQAELDHFKQFDAHRDSCRTPKRRASIVSTFASPNTRGGELVRPAPPLFRPTTFWRHARRSGVTGSSYSPASHLIRRSTFIAAGLALDAPRADLSALSVESRSRVGFVIVKPLPEGEFF